MYIWLIYWDIYIWQIELFTHINTKTKMHGNNNCDRYVIKMICFQQQRLILQHYQNINFCKNVVHKTIVIEKLFSKTIIHLCLIVSLTGQYNSKAPSRIILSNTGLAAFSTCEWGNTLIQCALDISRSFSLNNSRKTSHSSPVRAGYGLSFVSAKVDLSFATLIVRICA